ncbi:MAG: hypothetical protein AAF694_21370 [Bacteroidota bacterium]
MKYCGIFVCIVCIFSSFNGFAQSTYTALAEHGQHLNEASVRSWLLQNPSFQSFEWEFRYERTSPGGKHYTFLPIKEGIRLLGGMVRVNVDREGRVYSVVSDLPSQVDIQSKDFALAPKVENPFLEPESTSTWQKRFELKEGTLYPIWYQERSLRSPSATLNNAEARSILQDTVGWGRVFLPDPCTKGQVRYGELFEDNEDSHSPVFDALMDTVELLDITFEEGVFRLKGPYVEIFDITDREIPPVTSADGNFFFTRDESGFEDVMAYYHIDRFQRYIQVLGFTNLQNRTIRADTHGFIGDQSEFVRLGDASYLKFGEGGVDDAEDADVIIHEYAHAISYDANRPERYSCERLGLDEGIADYFAAGYSWDINPYDWENLFNWDGNNPFFPGRSVAITTMYPLGDCSLQSGENDINDWGQIWASAMMNLRNEIGGIETDRIMLQALYGLTEESGFTEAAQLVLEADELLYQGAHTDRINFWFCQQGILGGSTCLSVSRGEELPHSQLAGYRFHSERESSKLTFHWEGIYSSKGLVTLQVYNQLGQEVFAAYGPSNQKWKETHVISGGLHVFKLMDSSGMLIHAGKIWVGN